MNYLADLTESVVKASRVRLGERVGSSPANSLGVTVIRPGGRDCYPCFWVRDFVMSLESGFIDLSEAVDSLRLIASKQAESFHAFPAGGTVVPGAIVDHIHFDGVPIYFAGARTPEDQGGRFGVMPSLDNHFFFVHLAWWCVQHGGGTDLLRENVNGQSLINRLDIAYSVPAVDPGTGLVICTEQDRGVNFGFYDTIIHTGNLLFCSLLRQRAARELAWLHLQLGQNEHAIIYQDTEAQIRRSIPATFQSVDGLLRASTGRSNQPDVWGSAFGVSEGLFEPQLAQQVSCALNQSYLNDSLTWQGQIRHVRPCDDASDRTSWDTPIPGFYCSKDWYQNGGYWATPTGWVVESISHVDMKTARKLAEELVEGFRAGDYRQTPKYGQPYEFTHPNGKCDNPVYMTSVTVPFACFKRIGWDR